MKLLNNNKWYRPVLLGSLVIIMFLSSCSVKYSMNGVAVSPELKTVSVAYFQNMAPIVYASLSQQLTEALREKCRNQTRLVLLVDNGDVAFDGEIVGYDTRPTAIQGNDVAAKNRFTIRVRVRYTNIVDSKLSYDQTFERYRDFAGNLTLADVENDGKTIKELIEELTDDIFNKAFVNW